MATQLELVDDTLYFEGRKIELFLLEDQRSGMITGHELHGELKRRGRSVGEDVLNCLVAQPWLWPETWKRTPQKQKIFIFFWGGRVDDHSHDMLMIPHGCWEAGKVVRGRTPLFFNFSRFGPAASYADPM